MSRLLSKFQICNSKETSIFFYLTCIKLSVQRLYLILFHIIFLKYCVLFSAGTSARAKKKQERKNHLSRFCTPFIFNIYSQHLFRLINYTRIMSYNTVTLFFLQYTWICFSGQDKGRGNESYVLGDVYFYIYIIVKYILFSTLGSYSVRFFFGLRISYVIFRSPSKNDRQFRLVGDCFH